ncbi:hypothetical protein [Streptomyces sp. CC208A]|uniref:DUF7660 family protein n=1 Tax=Streptomyces sp. CC208A TaxID=3044573 RepID=UPI0024A9A3BA|nr:hypothetical protein [Streptomyces sp. CC208A]
MVDIQQMVEGIETREELAEFLRLATEDLKSNPQAWENDSLESFLSAWSAWVTDCPGWFSARGEMTPDIPDWKLIGRMVLAARVYE